MNHGFNPPLLEMTTSSEAIYQQQCEFCCVSQSDLYTAASGSLPPAVASSCSPDGAKHPLSITHTAARARHRWKILPFLTL